MAPAYSESGQHPIIVGQAAYNSAYGTGFAASSNVTPPAVHCNAVMDWFV